MAKAVRKKGKNRKLKRSIRKTLGAMFLASALAVAAIPTEGLQAADGDAVALASTSASGSGTGNTPPHTGGVNDSDPMKVSIAPLGTTSSNMSTIPSGWSRTEIPDIKGSTFNTKVYTSEKLNLQFVVDHMYSQNAYAVIVGYNNQMQLDNVGNVLTIPDTVDAYADLKGFSCAIGGNNGELLFYRTQVDVDTVSGGDIVSVSKDVYRPCLSINIDEWQDQEYNPVTKEGGLYFIEGLTGYDQGIANGYVFDSNRMVYLADSSSPNGRKEIPVESWERANGAYTQRIKGIKVQFIGNQYVSPTDTDTSNVQTVTEGHGIFSDANVSSLVVKPNLQGIGNYAFAGAPIKTVELSESIKEIGNYAFSGCYKLDTFSINKGATAVVIGDHAFSNCTMLGGFDAKTVTKIGDSAFEGCVRLTNINLLYEGKTGTTQDANTGALQNLGYYAFVDCSSLQEIIFPSGYKEKILISTFKGCRGLTHIYATGSGPILDFEEDDYYSFEDFRLGGNPALYFEGAKGCDLEKTVVDNYFVYKYTDKEIYKKKVPDESSVGTDGKYLTATFEVTRVGQTDIGEISDVQIDKGLKNLKIPGVIGPLSVTAIGEGGFEDNCDLVSVVIPPTITGIGANAFKGCHNLNSVIFEDASRISRENIGENAFATQSVGGAHNHTSNSVLDHNPKLYFTGTAESGVGPFDYAMDKEVFISAGSQTPAHITYYSGWPSNLTIENRDGVATLTNYPTIKQLMAVDSSFNNDKYPYFTMDANYEPAAYAAFRKYLGMTDDEWGKLYDLYKGNATSGSDGKYPNYDLQREGLTGYEQQIVDSTLNVLLPKGIVAIEKDLFKTNEAEGDYAYLLTNKYLEADSVSGGDIIVADRLLSTNGQRLGKMFTVNLENLADEVFADCKMLETINIGPGTKTIGDYAFRDCSYLQGVNVGPNVETMGLVPFIGCNKLARVNLNYDGTNSNFICEESVLFGKASDGTVSRIIEYLNGADYKRPSKDVLAKTTEIAEEAFRDTGIEIADFGGSTITTIPRYAFSNTKSLTRVRLPHTVWAIEDSAFSDSAIRELEDIPSTLTLIEPTAFTGVPNFCTFHSPEGAYAQKFADNNLSHPNLKWEKSTEVTYYTIKFCYIDGDQNIVYVHTEPNVREGDSVNVDKLLQDGAFDELPKEINGLVFKRTWEPKNYYTNVKGDNLILEVRAVYGAADRHTVTFLDKDNNVIWSNEVPVGGNIYIPTAPAVAGMTFSSWESLSPGLPGTYTIKDLDTLTVDVTFRAVYTNGTGSSNNPGGNDPNNPGGNDPNNPGGNDPNNPGGNTPGGSDPNNPGGTNPGGTTSGNGSGGTYYTLTVVNGHGSGSYVEGGQAIISANDPVSGMEFSNWTIDPSGTKIASTGMSATVITMPAANVTVTAHYRAKTGSTSGSGNTSSANAARRPNNTGTLSGGTTVVIDKNGISNTGVVAATVNGSSDNFVIKITENSVSSEAVVRALMAEYGSLDNIKYFPMDITLYDATGTNKITDTTGLSVSITLPIPDSLITYAGNNRVAGVVNDRLDKLTPKFTTISGVSCITFTAEHFSPYVIYVDTANLTAGGSADATPKTGDGIHPKWFLSIGLACLSFVMFMQKDKRKPRKVKVRA